MSSQPRKRLTADEYLALERQAETKSEYVDGGLYAMSGASPRHALITGNIVQALGSRLREKPCFVFPSDLRLHVSPTGLFTYPDVVVACGELKYRDDRRDTLLNPLVLFEVLSESTEAYDRGRKFEHYRSLASLAEYLLVAQDKPHVEQFVKQPSGRWLLGEMSGLEGRRDPPERRLYAAYGRGLREGGSSRLMRLCPRGQASRDVWIPRDEPIRWGTAETPLARAAKHGRGREERAHDQAISFAWSVISTAARAFETGQPCFAPAASSWNFASSMPGTCASH